MNASLTRVFVPAAVVGVFTTVLAGSALAQAADPQAGQVVKTQQSTVSADGKTRTVTTKGVNAAGQKINNVAVYERQQGLADCRVRRPREWESGPLRS